MKRFSDEALTAFLDDLGFDRSERKESYRDFHALAALLLQKTDL